jgi:hypothetical protein
VAEEVAAEIGPNDIGLGQAQIDDEHGGDLGVETQQGRGTAGAGASLLPELAEDAQVDHSIDGAPHSGGRNPSLAGDLGTPDRAAISDEGRDFVSGLVRHAVDSAPDQEDPEREIYLHMAFILTHLPHLICLFEGRQALGPVCRPNTNRRRC